MHGFPQLLVGILVMILVYTISDAHARRSSGRRIIDTAKKAMQEATRRHKRDTTDELLESLLLPNRTNSHLVEFDLILDDDQFGTVYSQGKHVLAKYKYRREKRKAVRHSIYHWPGAVVPYEIHSSVDRVSSLARHRIKKAMTHWERHTCIKFEEYNPLKHKNYVTIQKGQWCASKLGMAGGVQPLYIALGCLDTGTIIHELGHTIGWVHEQARPDRDDYITIKWSLVSASYRSQYVKHGKDFVNTYGVPYDYDSIMHYPSYGELITKDKSAQHRIGQRNRLSFYDIQLANTMYKCAERSKCDTSKVSCINGGFIDHTCKCVCPHGSSSSCTVINKPFPGNGKTTTVIEPKCEEWIFYDNSYIPGYNEDVGFALSVEQCKERCMQEILFKCVSFDYWKQRRQCYLSSQTVNSLGIRFSRDSRMTHYVMNDCNTKLTKATTIPTTAVEVTTSKFKPGVKITKPVIPTKPGTHCPFEYHNTGLKCVRALDFPTRPVHIAETECERKLGAEVWEMDEKELKNPKLKSVIEEGEEYWVKIKDFKSNDIMATFFDFCPYITKQSGKLVQKETLCFKQKGFICQLPE